jgi:hypothetical protein
LARQLRLDGTKRWWKLCWWILTPDVAVDARGYGVGIGVIGK